MGLSLSGIPGNSGIVHSLFSSSLDPDALAYIVAVETADGQALEESTRNAINSFVIGCKADGIWAAIKTSCILAGARTLPGALVPLVGPAPVSTNFVAGDYSRSSGLKSNGINKWLTTGRIEDSIYPHLAVWVTSGVATDAKRYIGGNDSSLTVLAPSSGNGIRARVGNSLVSNHSVAATVFPSLIGVSRLSDSSYNWAAFGDEGTQASNRDQINDKEITVFSSNLNRDFDTVISRIAFYSTGSTIALPSLRGRLNDLMLAYGSL